MIVFGTLGSHGDLHPYLALARELKRRGRAVRVATVEYHRGRVESAGIEFRPLRPNVLPTDREIVAGTMDPRKGPEFIVRKVLIPSLRDTLADFEAACDGARLIVNHTLNFPGMLVAERRRIPWVSTALAPIAMASAYDPPVFGGYEWLTPVHALGPAVSKLLLRVITFGTERWVAPYYELRRELGLSKGANPLFEGQYSPHLALAMYSSVMGGPKPDWPSSMVQSGFAMYEEPGVRLSDGLVRFLDAGEPPIVFTLGTAAVHTSTAGDFYAESFRAVRSLGRRAVFLIGADSSNRREGLESDSTFVAGYEPFDALFRRASVVVHQGGIGTTAQALRAGHPMLVVPFGNDQSDNAARVVRLGVGRGVLRHAYVWRRARFEFGELLENRRYAERARVVAPVLLAENGAGAACDAIERLLARSTGV